MQSAPKHPRGEPSSSSVEPEGPAPKIRRLAEDDEIDQNVMKLAKFPSPLDDDMAPILLTMIAVCSKGRLEPSHALDVLEKHPEMIPSLREAFAARHPTSILRLPILQKQLPVIQPLLNVTDKQVSAMESKRATVMSWEAPYVGQSHQTLWDQIRAAYQTSLTRSYAHTLSITQSSGTGKSRLVDEFSKEHFVIPLNLRDSDGYPPADSADIRRWLLEPNNASLSTQRLAAFLLALFMEVAETIENIDLLIGQMIPPSPNDEEPMSISMKFRLLMTYGQSYGKPGRFREYFYHNVLEIGRRMEVKVKTETSESDWDSGLMARDDLAKRAENVINLVRHVSRNDDHINSGPYVILAFDEAQAFLHPPPNAESQPPWNPFSELGRILHSLSRIGLFSLFLSTSRKIRELCPPAVHAASSRIQQSILHQPSPFTAVGFDHLAPRTAPGEIAIEEASTIGRIVKFGRPLFGSRYEASSETVKRFIVDFAREKLLASRDQDPDVLSEEQKLACLAMRMPIQFDASHAGSENADALVARHMRLCLDADPASPFLVTISPSEPILAAAARSIMSSPNFHPAEALSRHLGISGLDKGNRGELIAMLLLTLAYDSLGSAERAVPIIEFLQGLIPTALGDSVLGSLPFQWQSEDDKNQQLKDAFSGAVIWFNHFVKVHDYQVLRRRYLCALMTRGAAILCADGQVGVDLVIPFIAGDHTITEENIGVIMIQVKNDKTYGARPREKLYGVMDPRYLCGSHQGIPCIRMVFALASDRDAVTVLTRQREGQPRRESTKKFHEFTAYDIWFAQASSKTFRPIHSQDEDFYKTMLRLTKVIPKVYDDLRYPPSVRTALRTMSPGTTADEAHWRFFSFSGASPGK
ncbi:hypothetical protein BS47DRAFT_1488645 [Hydnum rufescens UP504]|uniref:Uncharacterized protein n=1 Tax=Hydnum rufescens UP504 TaxID=1448309 RepID=A0A9P6AL73_9AGAM|nr:hypothetical protein BS47DRAFT_1488645 [Hydnum rufescens UP504]